MNFKKGDYIVVLRDNSKDSRFIKNNYCFKQHVNKLYLYVEKDLEGYATSCQTTIEYSFNNWRYATKEEINYYNKINKPYDVSVLKTIKQNLLKEAKEKYPIGTKVKSLVSPYIGEIIQHNDNVNSNNEIWFLASSSNHVANINIKLYNDGEWAEVISESKIYIPKIDDWIFILEGKSQGSKDFKNQVKKVTSVDNTCIMIEDCKTGIFTQGYKDYSNEYRKVLPHEIPNDDKPKSEKQSYKTNWKVGDKFQVTKDYANCSRFVKNKDYIITSITEEGVRAFHNSKLENSVSFNYIKPVESSKENNFWSSSNVPINNLSNLYPNPDLVIATGLGLLSNLNYDVDPYKTKSNNKYKEIKLVSFKKNKKAKIKQIKLN